MSKSPDSCVVCGKPLGSRERRCYSCKDEQVENGEYGSESEIEREDVVERVRRYIHVSIVRCSDCGELHGEVELGDETVTAADFGIESEHEWEVEMAKEEEWLEDHEDAVRDVLPELEAEWPQTVSAIRTYIL